MMKVAGLLLLALLCSAAASHAQAATAIYDHPTSVTSGGVTTPVSLATVQAWTPTLYVNNVAFALTHTCVAAGAVYTCTATLPNITTALTPSGAQTFQVSLKDTVLGESLRGSPLVLLRPSAPTAPRIQ